MITLLYFIAAALLVLVLAIWLTRRTPDHYEGLGLLDQQDQGNRDEGQA